MRFCWKGGGGGRTDRRSPLIKPQSSCTRRHYCLPSYHGISDHWLAKPDAMMELTYKNQFSPLICGGRKWGEWAWNLLTVRPMVRVWGRDEQNLTPASSRAPWHYAESLDGLRMKWNRSLLLRKTYVQNQNKGRAYMTGDYKHGFLFPLLSMVYHWNSPWRGTDTVLWVSYYFIGKKGWGQGDMDIDRNQLKFKKWKTTNKHMEAKALQTI